MKILKWGFIGCGEVCELKSGPAFNEVAGSSVVAVMSRSEQKARSYAERHNVPRWYTDAQELIDDEEVNAVYVATPPSSHATFAIMAMKAGKPVYVEKPLASTYDDCARINNVSAHTGVPCFVAYYRRYLPYFHRVKKIIDDGVIGDIVNVQVRFATPPRDLDYAHPETLPWRLQPEISGGGYFYDLAPHQIDLLQQLFGVILDARGICTNRGHLYSAEDSVSAIFRFESGVLGSGSWSFVAHESARIDRILIIGTRGLLSFSVFTYAPIELHTSKGTDLIDVPNPPYVQFPLIKSVIEHLQGLGVCSCTSVSATPTNWVLDRILGKL
ncbi:MAG: Gfo/Idh/MocA family oxidoreductase [Prevotella sp.]|nr:Gfo/Idh/MocA family oxidoreductase [Prevotella sp.]